LGKGGRSNAGCRIKNKTNSKSALLNYSADGCDGSGSREKNDGFYFNIQFQNTGCIKKEHVPRREGTALRNKVSQNRGRNISRIPSESHVAC
jgi:hypothetical protein